MNRKHPIIRFVLPFLFVFVLITPLTEKSLHELEHIEKTHCAGNPDAHFHKADHSCLLCDYQVSPALESVSENESGIISTIDFSYLNTAPAVPQLISYCSIPARAPPTV